MNLHRDGGMLDLVPRRVLGFRPCRPLGVCSLVPLAGREGSRYTGGQSCCPGRALVELGPLVRARPPPGSPAPALSSIDGVTNAVVCVPRAPDLLEPA